MSCSAPGSPTNAPIPGGGGSPGMTMALVAWRIIFCNAGSDCTSLSVSSCFAVVAARKELLIWSKNELRFVALEKVSINGRYSASLLVSMPSLSIGVTSSVLVPSVRRSRR